MAQVQRLVSRWWGEGWSPTDVWPSVFVPESCLDRTGRRRMDAHACWSHPVAAELIWAFLDGRSAEQVVATPGQRLGGCLIVPGVWTVESLTCGQRNEVEGSPGDVTAVPAPDRTVARAITH